MPHNQKHRKQSIMPYWKCPCGRLVKTNDMFLCEEDCGEILCVMCGSAPGPKICVICKGLCDDDGSD
jgi:hypothetical protein